MRLPKLDMVTGEAARVAFTAAPRADAFADPVNRTSVAVRMAEGAERDLVFEDCTVGVAPGHTLSAAYAQGPKREQVLVLVMNHTTGQRQTNDAGLKRAASQRSIRARWRALLGGALAGLAFFGVALWLRPGENFAGLAAAVAFGGAVILWMAFAAIDALVLPRRERDIAERLRLELEGRLHRATPPSA